MAKKWHYEDYYCCERWDQCRMIEDGDDVSGNPALVDCPACLKELKLSGLIPPAIGDGATYGCWTDRYAGTVVNVLHNGKTVWVQEDDAKRTDNNGMSESQTYEYAPNKAAQIHVFTLRKNGRFNEKGCPMGHGLRVSFGHRSKYHDFSF